jgi:phosphate transport system substrate-binding protein
MQPADERSAERGTTVHLPLSKRALVGVLGLAVLAGACSSSSSGTTLNGSGSSFQKPFDEAAIAAYTSKNSDMTVNYAGGGSGKGKSDLQTKTVDFAGTDSTVKPEDLGNYQGGNILYFPTVAAPITVSYNVSGLDKLSLSPKTLAQIFQAKITKWNDAAIAKDNPGVTLPSTPIVIVHRADGSGTTSNFTKYLAAAAGSTWTLGSGDTVNWPTNSQAGTGNPGVAQIIGQTDGSIGYVDFADATAAKLKTASVVNADGKSVAPTLAGAAAAVASSEVAPDLTYSPLNQPGAEAYPITSPTWIIAYKNQTNKDKGDALEAFLQYLLTDGQGLAEANNYAKLPESLRQKSEAQLSQLQIPSS